MNIKEMILNEYKYKTDIKKTPTIIAYFDSTIEYLTKEDGGDVILVLEEYDAEQISLEIAERLFPREVNQNIWFFMMDKVWTDFGYGVETKFVDANEYIDNLFYSLKEARIYANKIFHVSNARDSFLGESVNLETKEGPIFTIKKRNFEHTEFYDAYHQNESIRIWVSSLSDISFYETSKYVRCSNISFISNEKYKLKARDFVYKKFEDDVTFEELKSIQELDEYFDPPDVVFMPISTLHYRRMWLDSKSNYLQSIFKNLKETNINFYILKAQECVVNNEIKFKLVDLFEWLVQKH